MEKYILTIDQGTTSTRPILFSKSGEIVAIRKSINASFWLHLFIALTTIAILLFIGYFLFSGFLNISEQRLIAAQVVFYSMCVSVFFQIVCTPLVALITSHENFALLTVITIFNSLFKLAIAVYISFADMIFYNSC